MNFERSTGGRTPDEFSPSELEILGRTDQKISPLTLFWTASGIRMNVKASAVWLEITVDYDRFEPWIDVILDGARTQRRMLDQKGTYRLCVYQGMEADKAREIMILRDTPAMPGDERTLLQINRIDVEGECLPVKKREYKIEFIGDSLTSGEGGCGAQGELCWNSGCFDCVNNYTFMTGQMLNAQYRCISQSGWGVYCSYRGMTEESIPPVYKRVCGLLTGKRNEELGAQKDWDFSSWVPDVVVVNLGTNDAGSFYNMGRVDPENGFVDPMRIRKEQYSKEDGSVHWISIPYPEDLELVRRAAAEFVETLREVYPHSLLIWCYGMCEDLLDPMLEGVIRADQEKYGDNRTIYVKIPVTLPEEMGSREHPGETAHRRLAEILSGVIREKIPR